MKPVALALITAMGLLQAAPETELKDETGRTIVTYVIEVPPGPINPRRVYMFGKGEGSKISMEYMMTHPDVVTAAGGYSWGAWLMPSELKEPLDFENQAPEIYLTLGWRDLDNHLSCVRDACLWLRAKGYHLIHREFDDLADRSYHPASNDDAIAWATPLHNESIPPSAEESKLPTRSPVKADGYYPALALVGGAPAGAILEKLFASNDAAVRVAAADPADRVNAADGLAYAVRLQVKGVRQDPAMFRALVSLLQDKAEPVRAQSTVAMMYANGKGVAQNYAEAGKWWTKAARHAWNLYRNGEGVERNPTGASQMAVLIGAHPDSTAEPAEAGHDHLEQQQLKIFRRSLK